MSYPVKGILFCSVTIYSNAGDTVANNVRGLNLYHFNSLSELDLSVLKCAIHTPDSFLASSHYTLERLAVRAESTCDMV